MNSCSPAGNSCSTETSAAKFPSCPDGPAPATHRHAPAGVRAYRSTPLTPVAGMCPMASSGFRRLQRQWISGESVTNRAAIPAESCESPLRRAQGQPTDMPGVNN